MNPAIRMLFLEVLVTIGGLCLLPIRTELKPHRPAKTADSPASTNNLHSWPIRSTSTKTTWVIQSLFVFYLTPAAQLCPYKLGWFKSCMCRTIFPVMIEIDSSIADHKPVTLYWCWWVRWGPYSPHICAAIGYCSTKLQLRKTVKRCELQILQQ
jgi:hypothetical protein